MTEFAHVFTAAASASQERRAPVLPSGSPSEADAIIVLTGGIGRIEEAYKIRTNPQQPILISGFDEDYTCHVLKNLNAAKHKTILATAALTTVGNAMEIADWVRKNPTVKSATIVTSAEHMRRAKYEVLRYLPHDIEVDFRAVPNPAARKIDLATEFLKSVLARSEIFRSIYGLDRPVINLKPNPQQCIYKWQEPEELELAA